MTPIPGDVSAVSRDAILEHLGKVLSSQLFQASERSTNLLRFLVDQTVNGETSCLKEYTLGAEALGRGSSFDPRTDTIVRAEVSRLRGRLEKYYATEGQTDSVVLTLPRGTYVPQFRRRTLPPKGAADIWRGKTSPPARIAWLALALGAAACVFAVVVMWSLWRVPGADNAVSIAVLPFANVSTDLSQEFFADGMTDEISGVLAKIPDLRVVGRTSAFQFKGRAQDLRTIGQSLGATHLIEGSVRKAGNRVRITAQLIYVDKGLQLWSETYDRDVTDIFAIQEDIAQAIAGALRVPLGLKPGEALISNRIADPKIYEQYLRGRAQLRQRSMINAFATLEGLVALAPGFAPGWAALANAYGVAWSVSLRSADFTTIALLEVKAETAARKAIQLDENYVGGYSELGGTLARRGKWAEAEDLYKQALGLNPNDPELLHNYSTTLFGVGRLREALGMRERLRALEPLVSIYNQVTTNVMQANGQIDASIPILELDTPHYAPRRNVNLANAYSAKGRFAEAADTLLLIKTQINRHSVEDAARLLRAAPSKTNAPEKLPPLDAELNFVYAYVGAPDRMIEYPETALAAGQFRPIQMVWDPLFAQLRKTERFKVLIRNAGLVDYWRARGWPDLCRPVGVDDFLCD